MRSLRESWEEQAEAWVRWARTPEHDQFFWKLGLPAFLELLPEPGRLTLDIGCGEGRVSRELCDRGYRVVGFDGSQTMVRYATSHERAVPAAVADAAALPVRDHKADLVVSYMVLQDVDDLARAVKEFARVLGGGGRVCAAFIHPMNSAAQIDRSSESELNVSFPHDYFETRRTLDVIDRDGIRMDFHSVHHSLEHYTRAFEDAGLLIESIREPKIGAELIEERPQRELFTRVPWALMIRAIRSLWA
ncbi:MAG: class I SAM-dependent methyltransferase [Actinomycetota bacterium]